MTTITTIFMVIKLLDAIHDFLIERHINKISNEDLENMMQKLTDIESLILQMKDGKNGKS